MVNLRIYTSAYNKELEMFEEGIKLIQNKNRFVLYNVTGNRTDDDMTDIRSFYMIEVGTDATIIHFKPDTNLPEDIQKEILELFHSVWP